MCMSKAALPEEVCHSLHNVGEEASLRESSKLLSKETNSKKKTWRRKTSIWSCDSMLPKITSFQKNYKTFITGCLGGSFG